MTASSPGFIHILVYVLSIFVIAPVTVSLFTAPEEIKESTVVKITIIAILVCTLTILGFTRVGRVILPAMFVFLGVSLLVGAILSPPLNKFPPVRFLLLSWVIAAITLLAFGALESPTLYYLSVPTANVLGFKWFVGFIITCVELGVATSIVSSIMYYFPSDPYPEKVEVLYK